MSNHLHVGENKRSKGKVQVKSVRRFFFACFAIAFLFLAVSETVFAGGYQIYGAASPEAIALGAAVSGRDDLVSNAWYNPAAVMKFKDPVYNSGYSLVKLNWEYEPGNGAGKVKIKDQTHMIPGSHLICPINNRYTAAFSLYTPFGLGIQWDDNDIRRLADSGIFDNPGASPAGMMLTRAVPSQIDLKVPVLTSTIATRVNDRLSLAAGPALVRADMKLRFHSRGTLLPGTIIWDSFIKYQADGWGLGYVLAAHYQAGKDWKFGARYLSNADVKMKGTVEDHPQTSIAEVQGNLILPCVLTFGCVNTGLEKWILSCDISRTEWSRYSELKIERSDKSQTKGGFNTLKNWKDTFSYRLGAEYLYNEFWTFRAGYVYDNSPVSEESRNFELPGTDGQVFSFGASRKSHNYVYDLGYSYMLLKNGKAGSDALGGRGEFTAGSNHFLMLSLTRTF